MYDYRSYVFTITFPNCWCTGNFEGWVLRFTNCILVGIQSISICGLDKASAYDNLEFRILLLFMFAGAASLPTTTTLLNSASFRWSLIGPFFMLLLQRTPRIFSLFNSAGLYIFLNSSAYIEMFTYKGGGISGSCCSGSSGSSCGASYYGFPPLTVAHLAGGRSESKFSSKSYSTSISTASLKGPISSLL